MTLARAPPLRGSFPAGIEVVALSSSSSQSMLGIVNEVGFDRRIKCLPRSVPSKISRFLPPIKAIDESEMTLVKGKVNDDVGGWTESGSDSQEESVNECVRLTGKSNHVVATVGKSTNIMWHECSVGKLERQKLLQQKGCVIWITGLSGSGKSTVACALNRGLYYRGKLSYILDGDNVRHGLNRDLSFAAEDRAENIRRVGEVAKLFADAGIICIASLISPYRRDRDACRALMTDKNFIEVFMDVPLQVCESRDPKGLYKLARAGKIRGFTGIDDPYEPPLNCEIVLQHKGVGASPCEMAEEVIFYLEEKGFLHA